MRISDIIYSQRDIAMITSIKNQIEGDESIAKGVQDRNSPD